MTYEAGQAARHGPEPGGEGPLRRLVLGILILGHFGLGAELLLLEHTERPAQWIPVVLLGLGLVAIVARLVRPGGAALGVLSGVMLLDLVAGGVGIALHYRGNVEFARELTPGLGGVALVGKALTGAFPALAPGALIQLGLVGLAYVYRHPLRHTLVAVDRRS